MCHRRCRRGCGCWVRRRPARTTATMPCRPRSPGVPVAPNGPQTAVPKPTPSRSRPNAACREIPSTSARYGLHRRSTSEAERTRVPRAHSEPLLRQGTRHLSTEIYAPVSPNAARELVTRYGRSYAEAVRSRPARPVESTATVSWPFGGQSTWHAARHELQQQRTQPTRHLGAHRDQTS
jgi:hypothetical protein